LSVSGVPPETGSNYTINPHHLSRLSHPIIQHISRPGLIFGQHIVVSHGGANVGMAKLGLGDGDVFAALDQVCGISVGQSIGWLINIASIINSLNDDGLAFYKIDYPYITYPQAVLAAQVSAKFLYIVTGKRIRF